MKITNTTVYLTDNGRALCGQHLGSSAKHTGRDISGQQIMPITRAVADEAREMGMDVPSCETCGAQWDDAAVFAKHIAKVGTMTQAELAAIVVEAPKNIRARVR